jgi:uncharacterized protein (DUF58 family)
MTSANSEKKGVQLIGLRFALAAAVMLLAAWNTGNNLFHLLFAGMGALLLASFVLPRLSLAKTTVSVDVPRSAERSVPFDVRLHVRNGKKALASYALSITRDMGEEAQLLGFIQRLAARSGAELQFSTAFERRGVHNLPPLTVRCAFPFGFFAVEQRMPHGPSVLVYPRVLPVRLQAISVPEAEAYARPRKGEGDEFFGLREYQRGDDLRRVAWRASAKRDVLLVRETASDASRHAAVLLDARRMDDEAFEERFEEAVDLTASVAVHLLNHGQHVMLTAGATRVSLGEGPAQINAILEALAHLEPVESGNANIFEQGAPEDEGLPLRTLCISPDTSFWGRHRGPGGALVLNPREVLRV